mmetsp:Transcript_37757/g.119135  ORF Transcript_37757/g.119135 Transcript_37757/m.119135 type:complete len:205 (-) Transcript_37757:43-657(-)
MLRQACRVAGHGLSSSLFPGGAPRGIAPALPALQSRQINFWEVFSKEKIQERRAILKEDINHGYWHEFKDMNTNKGKVFPAWTALAPTATAAMFPAVEGVVDVDGADVALPPVVGGGVRATLITVAFRASGQKMAKTWATPFGEHFMEDDRVGLLEFSITEPGLLTIGPMKGMLLSALKKGVLCPGAKGIFLVGQDTADMRRLL